MEVKKPNIEPPTRKNKINWNSKEEKNAYMREYMREYQKNRYREGKAKRTNTYQKKNRIYLYFEKPDNNTISEDEYQLISDLLNTISQDLNIKYDRFYKNSNKSPGKKRAAELRSAGKACLGSPSSPKNPEIPNSTLEETEHE